MEFGSYRFIRITHIRPTSLLKSPLETLRKIEFGSRLESLAKIFDEHPRIDKKLAKKCQKVKWTSFTEFYGLLKSKNRKN